MIHLPGFTVLQRCNKCRNLVVNKLSTFYTVVIHKVFSSTQHARTSELILYIATKLCSKPNYGSTLLNKALYFIDNIQYLKTGKPISDFTYVAQEFGPTPEPSQFLQVKQQLLDGGHAEMQEIEYYGRIQKRLLAKRDANLKDFSGEEIELVDNIISTIEDWDATHASEITHKYPAWQAASDREKLPFYTFLITKKAPSEEDIAWAKGELSRVLR